MKNLTHYLLLGTAFVFMLSSCTKPDSKPTGSSSVPPPTVKLTLSGTSVGTGNPLTISFVASSTINIKSFKIEDVPSGNTAGTIIKDSTVATNQLAYAMSLSTTTSGSRTIKVTVTDANNQSSSDIQPLVVTGPSVSMSATLNGTVWTAVSVSAINNSGYLGVIGSGSNNSSITIVMPANTPAGTDSIPFNGNYAITYSTPSNNYSMTKGTLVITSNANNDISGTFSGTMTDILGGSTLLTLTSGSFTAKY